MPGVRPALLAAAAATVAAVSVAAPAVAVAAPSAYTKMLNEYSQTGVIQPCQFTSSQLNDALKSIDLYGQAYFPDFPNAIQVALNNRASGGCSRTRLNRSEISAINAALAGPGGRGPFTGLRPGAVTASTSASLPAPILIMALLLAAFVMLAGGVALTRALGLDPAWAAAVRHSFGEAEYRLGGAWQEFRDRRR